MFGRDMARTTNGSSHAEARQKLTMLVHERDRK